MYLYLPAYLRSEHVPTYPPTYLPVYLPTCMHMTCVLHVYVYLPTYLPTHPDLSCGSPYPIHLSIRAVARGQEVRAREVYVRQRRRLQG